MSLVSRTSVIIPALNEEATVAAVVHTVLAESPLEVIVIDSDSEDDTATQARRAGARVINWREPLPHIAPQPGKGEALWRGVAAAQGEFVAFVDADLSNPHPATVSQLVAAFADPKIQLVKSNYQRGFHGAPTGGGRVTELTAKPLLRALFPQLSEIAQPLSGEYAIRAATARSLPFVSGYGVEIGLVIDVFRSVGLRGISQVDLGVRQHRNRPLLELAPMADEVCATILARAGIVAPTLAERPPVQDVI
ncbi:glucosyl-3-phosphoglycerate synthase [Staphylococcus chromogenes]|nr:glucosyl-3-phosphoglycerate synthase [Staphylococcus chromogenes]